MKRVVCAIILAVGLADGHAVTKNSASRIVLPNPALLRCQSSDCYQVWSEKPAKANAVFPKQVQIDTNEGCIYGLTALYDKSIAVDDIRAAIDQRYGKWAVQQFRNSPLKMWRIEPEKFAIQLHVADKQDEKRGIAEAGTREAIYVAFGGRSACNIR